MAQKVKFGIGDTVKCIKRDSIPSDGKNFCLEGGLEIGEEYTVSLGNSLYTGTKYDVIELRGVSFAHLTSNFELVRRVNAED